MALDPLEDKLSAFNWETKTINGHDLAELDNALKEAYRVSEETNKPFAIIANTIKGKGVSFMEDAVAWHGVAPSDTDLEKALVELAGTK